MIVDTLIEEAQERLDGRRVVDVRIGLAYTAVALDDGACGVAGTVLEGIGGACALLPDAGELVGQAATEMAARAASSHPVGSAVGLATVNAALNRDGEPGPGPLDVLAIDGATVGMVGYFGPLVDELGRRARALHVFERPPLTRNVLPDWAAPRILPSCDVVIITGVTLVNDTLDHLLAHCHGQVAVVGPTTPMSSALAGHGVHHLFGSVVQDRARLLEIVSQGGGTRSFGRAVRKVHLELRGG